MKRENIIRRNMDSNFIFFVKHWFKSNKQMSARAKFKSIIISLVLGLFLAFIMMWITTSTHSNPFKVFGTMVTVALNKNMLNYTLSLTGLLLVAGLANAIAFKTGLFNIGISGQMFFTGAMSVVLGLTLLRELGVLGLVILMWFAMMTGGIVAGIIGWLKAKFNVHEVVTSILLNWGLFYIARYIITLLGKTKHWGAKVIDPSGATKTLPPEFQINSAYYGVILLMIGLVIALIISIILWKSTFGHALKITGLSMTGSKYAGLKVNTQVIMSMALSGIIAGILGVMMFVMQDKQIGSKYLNFNKLPTIGFEGIAIALLAFSNPLGIIPIALLFGILKSGASGLVEYSIDNSFSDLIIGIVMYFAAISVLFLRFKPLKLLYVWFKINKKQFPKEYAAIQTDYEKMMKLYSLKFKNDASLITEQINQEIKSKNRKEIINGYIQDYKHLKYGFKNINKHRKTQIKLLKIDKYIISRSDKNTEKIFSNKIELTKNNKNSKGGE